MSHDLETFLRERNEILRTLDIKRAREKDTRGVSDEVILIGLHKARYEVTTMPPELRYESRKWLEERGYGRIAKLPFPADGSLPK